MITCISSLCENIAVITFHVAEHIVSRRHVKQDRAGTCRLALIRY